MATTIEAISELSDVPPATVYRLFSSKRGILNKRLGWLATAVFLEINDASVTAATNEAVYDLVIAVATSDCDLHQIASRLQQLAQQP